MNVKTFSVEEANDLLPKIKDSLDDILLMRKKASFAKSEIEWISEFWGKDLKDSDNADYDKFKQLEEEIGLMQGRMIGKIEKLESLGCIVRDIDAGLVDFYSFINGNLAFLCWKYGEKAINHWHGVDNGFGGRRQLTHVDKVRNK